MQIILKINDEEKTFVMPYVKARVLRQAVEFTEKMNFENLKCNDLDELIQFICNLYKNEFTIDDVWDGLEAKLLLPTILNTIQFINGSMGES